MEQPATALKISEEDIASLKAQYELIQGGMNSIFNAHTFVNTPLENIMKGELTAENFDELISGLEGHFDYGQDENWPEEMQAATRKFIEIVARIAAELGFEVEALADF